eukprot:9604780-Alexandrium_andersonii.AAC.1
MDGQVDKSRVISDRYLVTRPVEGSDAGCAEKCFSWKWPAKVENLPELGDSRCGERQESPEH